MASESTNQDHEQSEHVREDNQESDESLPVVDTVKDVVAQAGQEGLPLLVGTVVDALFSEPVRRRVQQEAEEGLQELLDTTIEALPESGAAAGLQSELERTRRQLRLSLRQMVDTLFTESTRTEFQHHMEEAVRELVEGDSATATQHAELAGQSLLEAILGVLNRHWSQVFRLLLGVVAKALQEALVAQVKEAFTAIAAQPAEAIEEKVEPLQEQLAERAEELRQRLAETRDTIQERLAEARERLQERVGSGISSAVGNGSQGGRHLGSPPSGRPPPGPAGSRTPGKAPPGRPPSISR